MKPQLSQEFDHEFTTKCKHCIVEATAALASEGWTSLGQLMGRPWQPVAYFIFQDQDQENKCILWDLLNVIFHNKSPYSVWWCNPISKLTFNVTATEIKHGLQRARRDTSMRKPTNTKFTKNLNCTKGQMGLPPIITKLKVKIPKIHEKDYWERCMESEIACVLFAVILSFFDDFVLFRQKRNVERWYLFMCIPNFGPKMIPAVWCSLLSQANCYRTLCIY